MSELVFSDTSGAPALPPDEPVASVFPDEPAAFAAGPRPGWSADESFPDDDYGDDDYGDDAYYDDLDDGELDDLPKRRGCRQALVVVAVLAVVLLIASWFAWSWVQDKIDPPGGQGDEVLVDIPEGTSTSGIGQVLADQGVISDAGVWNWYTKLRDVGSIQAGSYRMRLNSSFGEAIEALEGDPLPPDSRLVTIPEGLTQAQIAERLANPDNGVPGVTVETVQAALRDPSVRSPFIPEGQTLLEGTLFPETYAVEDGATALDVVKLMVDEFAGVAEEVDLAGRAEALGRSPYEVLIVASIIEREAGTPEDGPRVARVIYNRLAADGILGIDATSCYEKGEIPCELTTAELEDNSPYDTRSQPGLPPTPIASPGRASIEAALSPADGPWLWYVLDVEKNDDSSFFTDDYDEFLAAKQRCVDAGQCG